MSLLHVLVLSRVIDPGATIQEILESLRILDAEAKSRPAVQRRPDARTPAGNREPSFDAAVGYWV